MQKKKKREQKIYFKYLSLLKPKHYILKTGVKQYIFQFNWQFKKKYIRVRDSLVPTVLTVDSAVDSVLLTRTRIQRFGQNIHVTQKKAFSSLYPYRTT